jgi:Glycosyltransferase family 87
VATPRRAAREDGRWTRLLLLVPPALILVVAALTPTSSIYPDQGDLGLYLEKAHAFASGQVPYRDFEFFYPPGALLPMTVPYLAGLSRDVGLDAYKVLFAGWQAAEMLVLGVVLTRVAALVARDEWATAPTDRDRDAAARERAVALRLIPLAVASILALTWRYDLFPSLLVVIAVWATLEQRPAVAGVALGLGALAKIYPVALVPALAIAWLVPLQTVRLGRFVVSFLVAAAVGLAPFVALAGSGAFGFVPYQLGHGMQIESIGGGIAVLAGLIGGASAPLSFAQSRVQVDGPVASTWAALTPWLTVAAFGLLGLAAWRRIRLHTSGPPARVTAATVVALAAASVLLVLVTSKAFSIQYVVWWLPFAALFEGRRYWLALAIAALTIPIHPLLYGELIKQEALPVLILNLRNALLVALTAWVAADLARGGLARPAGLEPTTFRSAT